MTPAAIRGRLALSPLCPPPGKACKSRQRLQRSEIQPGGTFPGGTCLSGLRSSDYMVGAIHELRLQCRRDLPVEPPLGGTRLSGPPLGGTCLSGPPCNVRSSIPISPGTTSVPLRKNVGGTCSSRPLRDVGLSTVIHRARQACLSKKMLEGPACQVRHSTVNVCQATSLSPSIGVKFSLACQNPTEVGGLLSC
jgi:hypothetical protein